MGFTNNKTDKILEFKNQGIKAAAGTVFGRVKGNPLSTPLSSKFYSNYKFQVLEM